LDIEAIGSWYRRFAALQPPFAKSLTHSVAARDEDAEEGAEKKSGNGVVQSSGAAHTSACVALQRSPALPEFILTVGDWTFCIFKTGVKVCNPPPPTFALFIRCHHFLSTLTPLQTPLFVSPYSQSRLTAGRWYLTSNPQRSSNQRIGLLIASRSPTRPSVILIAKADGSME
jgi:hypothetical protein